MILNSTIDKSVNFIEQSLTGFLESRYVRKCPEYFITYLSSQNGCNKGCRFCHLTTTKQTSFVDATPIDFMGQACKVFAHYQAENLPARYVHFNFMARGEPLSNADILEDADYILTGLGQYAKYHGLAAKFNISSIFPVTLNKSLDEVFRYITPTIYYSLYSVNESWRKKWLPAAMPVADAGQILREYQNFSKKIIKIHYAFIENENDSTDDINGVCGFLLNLGLICEFNLVRYNPASEDQGRESSLDVIQRNINLIKERFKFQTKVQIIPRVGFDVFASCGMFASQSATASIQREINNV